LIPAADPMLSLITALVHWAIKDAPLVENLGDHRRVEPSADLGLEDLGQNHPDLTLAFTTAPTGAILDLAFAELGVIKSAVAIALDEQLYRAYRCDLLSCFAAAGRPPGDRRTDPGDRRASVATIIEFLILKHPRTGIGRRHIRWK
jgi:hypothetical protein